MSSVNIKSQLHPLRHLAIIYQRFTQAHIHTRRHTHTDSHTHNKSQNKLNCYYDWLKTEVVYKSACLGYVTRYISPIQTPV